LSLWHLEEIQTNNKEYKITPRKLIQAFGCEARSKGNVARINDFLEKNKLETIPNYLESWIDGEIMLKHKKRAKSKTEVDPIQRIKLLPAANKSPVSIKRESKISEAITIMMMHNFSQLPVMNNAREVNGVITWETIGYALTNGIKSELVKDFIKTDVMILEYDTPILDAVKIIIENDFALVRKKDKSISGIVTIADISSQYIKVTEPFLLLEQIESHIRLILNEKFLVEELQTFSIESDNRKIEYIDDLTFGEYIRIIEKKENWIKLNLSIDRCFFIKQLDKVREIRNDIMHFNSEGITNEQRSDLYKMSNFLKELKKFL